MIPFFQVFGDEETPVGPTLYPFTPPLGGINPHWRKETPDHERRFISHFRPSVYAVNIHKLIDGTFTEAEGYSPDLIEKTYRGSTLSHITIAEAIALIAAGYSVPSLED